MAGVEGTTLVRVRWSSNAPTAPPVRALAAPFGFVDCTTGGTNGKRAEAVLRFRAAADAQRCAAALDGASFGDARAGRRLHAAPAAPPAAPAHVYRSPSAACMDAEGLHLLPDFISAAEEAVLLATLQPHLDACASSAGAQCCAMGSLASAWLAS